MNHGNMNKGQTRNDEDACCLSVVPDFVAGALSARHNSNAYCHCGTDLIDLV